MNEVEKELLQRAITTIADPNCDPNDGWKILCTLARLNPDEFGASFAHHCQAPLQPAKKPARFRFSPNGFRL
jgi:hypothetical protein